MLKVNAEEGNTDEENVLVRIYQREYIRENAPERM